MSDDIVWLRKVTLDEEFVECYFTSYRLTLATRQPLLEKDLRLTLKHLFRKVPSLRLCFAERDGERWFREMPQEAIDLEIVSSGTTEELLFKVQQYKHNEMGPLWCVKLTSSKDSPDAKFPHVYDLFLGINHAITDGFSNVLICSFIVRLLDDVIAGRPVDDSKQLGVFASDEKTQELLQDHAALLEVDPQLRSCLQEEYESANSMNVLYLSTFKGIREEEAKTAMVTRKLDSATTSAFIKRCRAEGVTVNTAFMAFADVALVDLLVGEGLFQDTYAIRSDHAINVRRFWKGDSSVALGCHVLPLMTVVNQTPRNAKENLWSYVQLVNEKFQGRIKSGRILKEEFVKRSDPKTYKQKYDYNLTNMGDVTQMLGKGGAHVRVHNILRAALIDKMPSAFVIFLHTFCGQFNCTLVYNSFANSTVAKKYLDLIFGNIHASLQN